MKKIVGLIAGLAVLGGWAAQGAPQTAQNAAWNVNQSTNGLDPAGYYGSWPGHTYFPSPDDWRKIPVYQFITDRWADGDPSNNELLYGGYDLTSVGTRHGGDFRGIMNRLEYIKALGYKAIWISPIFQNRDNSYHGYGQIDFTLLDERFGTVEDMRAMVNRAHELGLYVIVDIIVNHLSDLYYFEGHQYDGAVFHLHEGEYRLYERNPGERYVDFPIDNTFQSGGKYCDVFGDDGYARSDYDNPGSGSFWASDLHHCGNLDNYGDPWQNHCGKIYGSLDDLRTTHPRVHNKIIAMTRALVASCDIDGIRMDTPMQVPRYFFRNWCPAVKSNAALLGKSDFLIFGEFYCSRERAATMVGRGKSPNMWGSPYTFIDSDYTMAGGINYRAYFDFFQSAIKDQANGSLGNLKSSFDSDLNAFDFYDPARSEFRYTHLNFYNNHDQWRMVHNPAGAAAGFKKTDLGSAILAFWPGMPLFYYGDEQGFCSYGTALDGWSREDFMTSLAWTNVNSLVAPAPNPALVDNFDMCNPHFLYVQKCMNIRSQYLALQNTDTIYERWRQSGSGNGIYAYSRAWGTADNWALVLFNTWSDWLEAGGAYGDFWTGWSQGDVVVNAFDNSNTYTLGQYGKLTSIWLAPYEVKVLIKQGNLQTLNPVVTNTYPRHDERVGSGAYVVKLQFSEPMNEASVKSAFRYDGTAINPANLTWTAAARELSYAATVTEGLHTIEVLSNAVSSAGKAMFGAFRGRFRCGSDTNIICNPNAKIDPNLVNNGASQTASRNVTLYHKATGAEKFRVQNEGEAWGGWTTYGATSAWTLPAGNGTKNLTVQYWADNSAAYYVNDSITLQEGSGTTTNGVPYSWLEQFGWSSDYDQVASMDQDGDGMPTWAEYVANTVPTNPASYLKTQTGMPNPAGNVIRWVSGTNRYYWLYWGTNLGGTYQRLGGTVTSTPPLNFYTDTLHNSEMMIYYRIKARLNP